jgi:hypothetical protein
MLSALDLARRIEHGELPLAAVVGACADGSRRGKPRSARSRRSTWLGPNGRPEAPANG